MGSHLVVYDFHIVCICLLWGIVMLSDMNCTYMYLYSKASLNQIETHLNQLLSLE